MNRIYTAITLLVLILVSCNKYIPDLADTSLNHTTNAIVIHKTNDLSIVVYPFLKSVSASGISTIKLTFNKPLALSSCTNISNYIIINNALIPLEAKSDLADRSIVFLKVSNMQSDQLYYIYCKELTDTSNNALLIETNSFLGYGSDDNISPSVSITEPVYGQWIGANYKICGSVNDNIGIKKVEVKIDSDDYLPAIVSGNSWEVFIDSSAYTGLDMHTIYAKALDLKGNSALTSSTFRIDTIPPVLNLTKSANNGSTNITVLGNKIHFTGNAIDNVQVCRIYFYISNKVTNYRFPVTWLDSSNWTFIYNHRANMEDDGTNIFVIQTSDIAQNKTTITRKVLVYQDTLYVRTNGNDANDGTYWQPKKTIVRAAMMNTSLWHNIYVANGIYSSFVTNSANNLFILGGYSQDFKTRSISAYRTVISHLKPIPLGFTVEGFKFTTNVETKLFSSMNKIYFRKNLFTKPVVFPPGSIQYSIHLYTNTFLSNLMISNSGWGSSGYIVNITGNIFSNSYIYNKQIFTNYSGSECLYKFIQNTVYGSYFEYTGGTIGGLTYREYIISNRFLGYASHTNQGIIVSSLYSGIPIRYVYISDNFISNFNNGIVLSNIATKRVFAYISKNLIYSKKYCIYEANQYSSPTNVVSNDLRPMSGYVYRDATSNTICNDTGTLNSLDDRGWNVANSFYGNRDSRQTNIFITKLHFVASSAGGGGTNVYRVYYDDSTTEEFVCPFYTAVTNTKILARSNVVKIMYVLGSGGGSSSVIHRLIAEINGQKTIIHSFTAVYVGVKLGGAIWSKY